MIRRLAELFRPLPKQVIQLGDKPDYAGAIEASIPRRRFTLHPTCLAAEAPSPPEVDLILPLRLSDYEILRDRPQDAAKALFPPKELCELAHDKPSFNRWLLSHGFAAQVPTLFDSPEAARFPLVIKGKRGEWGARTLMVPDQEGLDAALQTAQGWKHGYFLQAAIPGQWEYATHLVARDGVTLFSATVDKRLSDAYQIIGLHGPKIGLQASRRPTPPCIIDIVRQLGYSGIACFDYKMDGDTVRLFEMNPRFGATSPLVGSGLYTAYAQAIAERRAA